MRKTIVQFGIFRSAATLRTLWQGRWAGLAAAWLAGVAGLLLVYAIAEHDEAAARAQVAQEAQQRRDREQEQRALEAQIRAAEERLLEADRRVKAFRLDNLDLQPAAGQDFFSALASAEERLREARMRLSEARKSRQALLQHAGRDDDRPLKLALAEADAQVARLQTRVAGYERRLAELRKSAPSVPGREAQFKQLNLEYASQRQSYDALLERREALGSPPAAPVASPGVDAPARGLLIAAAALVSLLAGLAASALFARLRPALQDTRSLERLGHRVLGAVSLVSTPAVLMQRRRRSMLFVGGLGGLAAMHGGALALAFFHPLLPF